MRKRVLMLGADLGLAGGISTLVETLLPALSPHVDLLYMPTVRGRPLNKSGKMTLTNTTLAVAQYGRFLSVLRHFRPHLLHLHTSQGWGWLKDSFYVLVGHAAGLRVVLHVHAFSFEDLYAGMPPPLRAYTRRVMALADVVIAVSEEWSRTLSGIVPSSHLAVLRNCVSVADFRPGSPQRSHEPPKALFMGSIGPRKGAFDLLAAMRRVKEGGCSLHLWLAGYEERPGDMLIANRHAQQMDLSDCCIFVGVIGGAEKVRLLETAGLFVLPSRNEGLPMAILEAMAAGLPIVSTPVGGIPEVVREGDNGFLVSPGDVPLLADRLVLLSRDRPRRERMGLRSREIAEQELDRRGYAERLLALYESLPQSV